MCSTTRRYDGCLRATCLRGLCTTDRAEVHFYIAKQGRAGKFLQEDVVSLAYDIFGRLNGLKFSLQRRDKTIISFIDLLSAFQEA